jgi:hypothetical protein
MRGPLIGGKNFQLPLDKEASSRRGLGGVPKERGVSCFFRESKGENGGVRKRLIFKYGKVLFMEKGVQTRAWKEVVCSST